MKKLLLLLLFACPCTWAEDWLMHVNLGVKHFNRSEVIRDGIATGIGLTYQAGDVYLTGGYIPKNSFENESWYGGAGFEVYSVKNFGFGFQGVFASGYKNTSAKNGGFIGSALVRLGPNTSSLNIHIMGFSGIGFQCQFSF